MWERTGKRAEMEEVRISQTAIKNFYRRGFTMVELIVIVAIIGFLIAIVAPRISWTEDPKRVLQRSLLEAVETARKGLSLRFRAEKAAYGGLIVPEIFIKGEKEQLEGRWVELKMQHPPIGSAWKLTPEMLYFFSDGTCTPGRLEYGQPPNNEKFLMTVTGYLVDEK